MSCSIEMEMPDDDDGEYSRWSLLPDLVLEQILSHLTMREKYAASLVCRSWSRAFRLPRVWHTFVYEDSTLTRRKYNYYYGWQSFLDHMRTQNCLACIGRNIHNLILKPSVSFFNLYEFMNMLSYFAERVPPDNLGIGPNIHSLSFVFPCNMAVRESPDQEGTQIFGTGGRLLETLKRLMGNLASLRRLELTDLMLEPWEARHLLDEVCGSCSLRMTRLVLVNATRVPCPVLHVGVFLRLQVLVISPQSLGEDVLELLGQARLRHLHILQNCYSPSNEALEPVAPRAWQNCRRANPRMAVHLQGVGLKGSELLWQSRAPVHSVLYDSPHSKMVPESVLMVVDLYAKDLHVYGHCGLPKFWMPRSFHDRVDSLLLLLCRQCPNLHTLVVRDRISTSTVLLLAHTARNLRALHVRRNAVVLRRDWPRNPEWGADFALWLHTASRSYPATEQEVSRMMGRPWTMLSDKQFKMTRVNLHA
ncbi:uncharacterized protein LOC134533865 [Bacillus rossius redtenbacheri]|uniref:uncharacterized protein LOC134533865 n=1 Tax=Bacillus rossius redtenbacheri TaxID=93214 RepID=UPI002FDD4FA4